MAKKVGVISAGAWGTSMAKAIAENGHHVQMWDFMEDVVDDINNNHINKKFLSGVPLPNSISATTDIIEASNDKDYLLITTPSLFVLDCIKKITQVPGIQEGKTFISVLTKGFLPSPNGPRFLVDTIEDYLPGFYKKNVVYISGPSHAEEVARGKLTGLISACNNGKNAIRFRQLITNSYLMVFSSLDTLGVQTCAAIKNVIAIAYGMLDALMENSEFFGDNTESLLLAAGLNEIQSIGVTLGATHHQTFSSIAGVGDLHVTCKSEHGRNRRFGREIVKKNLLKDFDNIENLITNLNTIGYLPEGAVASKYVYQISEKYKLKLPICQSVYNILNRKKDPSEAIKEMLVSLTGSSIFGK